MASGPVTARITKSAPETVECEAWGDGAAGDGAAEFVDAAPGMLGADDDVTGFAPEEPTIAAAYRKAAHLRLGRTGRVLEALIPAVVDAVRRRSVVRLLVQARPARQRVAGADAFRSWRLLVTRYGAPAPGPRRPGCGCRRRRRCGGASRRGSSTAPTSTPPSAHDRRLAPRPSSLERLTQRAPESARVALTSLPGVGVWTAAETAQRAFGDADALSIGDYHLATVIGRTLVGHPIDDAQMVALLEPLRPHRYRAVRLLEVSGLASYARFGPRQAIKNLSKL